MMPVYGRIQCGLTIVAALGLLWAADSANAQLGTTAPTSRLQLPENPASWINSPPLSTELLKGKAAVFYLFEEG